MRLGPFSFLAEEKSEDREHGFKNITYSALLLLISIVHQWWVAPASTGEDAEYLLAVEHPVLPEAIKLALAVVYLLWQRRRRSHVYAPVRDDGLPLAGLNADSRRSSDAPLNGHAGGVSQAHNVPRIPPSIAYALAFLAGVVFTYQKYNNLFVSLLTDPFTINVATSFVALLTVGLSYAFLSQTFTMSQWQAILLLVCGSCIIQSSLITTTLPSNAYPIILSGIISTSIYLTLMKYMYTNLHSISLGTLHMILFSSTLLIRTSMSLHRASRSSAPPLVPQFTSPVVLPSLSQAALDLATLAVVYRLDAVSVGSLASLGAALYFLGLGIFHRLATYGMVGGCCIAIIGAVIYLSHADLDSHPKTPRHWVVRLGTAIALTVTTLWLLFTSHSTNSELLSATRIPKQPSILDQIASANGTCQRRPLASTSYFAGKRTYHAFDDVLLIVFFSHARYDVNLEYYREVYAEFFPNIVFVGPGSREDAGFSHSYDVLVDTYQADEDLSDPSFYKMAGRMAHHMLYTAMREYPCYSGYLWAPFDTLLNIPRLQQFDQRFFWYHSPFGQYVHNPALGDSAANQNRSRHAPPAKISPDPSVNLTATWRHWGTDWWWGEPHVGVHVCEPAFNKVPQHMRDHLASLTNGTRYIGGSADTLFIPGRHYDDFMHVLGLFLETNCFLEIATPTALHLVSPPEEPILFVDHWWIWQSPLNASFVRQQWAKGLEVDTFHTFHWGDKGPDGVWRGNPEHIRDVRRLLVESAARQGIEWRWGGDGLSA